MHRVLVPASITLTHPPLNAPVRDFAGQSMGTTWSVRMVDTSRLSSHDWQTGIQARLDCVVAQMSHWREDSNLGRYNRAPADTWHALPAEFRAVMMCALEIAEQSSGAYDPAIGALVDVWGFGPHGRHAEAGFTAPAAAEVEAARELSGWQRLRLDGEQRLFQPGGVRLDLSSIAKGYAVDLVADFLLAQEVEHFLVEVGGELRGAGMKADGQPWWVGLETPGAQPLPSTVLALHGLSVASSGDYRRSFEYQGRRYAHTLDPRNGHPLPEGVASVTVVHERCMLADAWSTAMTVMGVEAGLACADSRALAVYFLRREAGAYREYMSTAFAGMLQ